MSFKSAQHKAFAILLVIVMASAGLFATQPTSANAAPGDSRQVDTLVDLQPAVDAAANGDTITLTPAFATELAAATAPAAITILGNKSLTFNASAAGALTIGGTTAIRHFTFTNGGTGTVTLTGFKLSGNTSAASLVGTGGIDLGTTGSYVIKDSMFYDIAAGNLGALTGGKTVRVENCVFTGNLSRGIISPDGADYTLESCTFLDNTNTDASNFDQGGGVYFKGSGTSIVNNCNFNGNEIWANGGNQYVRGAAIYADGGNANLTIKNSMFSANQVVGTVAGHGLSNRIDGGAIFYNGEYIGADSFLVIEDSVFMGNFAQDDGGAMCIVGNQFANTRMHSTVRNCTFTDNTIAGAEYGRSINFIFNIEAWITDGCGGAIDYFGLTNSEITHSTFYNNGITDLPVDKDTSWGSVGGGGAIGVDTGENISNPSMLPQAPKLTNNIFVGNYITNPATTGVISNINNYAGNPFPNKKESSATGNVFVLPSTDRDIALDADPRGLSNNGNIGYDNGNWSGAERSYGKYYTSEGVTLPLNASNPNSGGIPVTVPGTSTTVKIPLNPETVFANTDTSLGGGADAVPLPEYFGAPVGATLPSGMAPGEDWTDRRFCYVPSPLSDEMYRDGSGPYYDASTTRDTLGYQRDQYPNAGAVEIYWTKFDPGVAQGGEWIASQVDFAALGGIQSQIDPNMYYLVTTPPPLGGGSPGSVTTFPRTSFELGSSKLNDPLGDYYLDYGFQGWKSNQPDTPGGSVFTPVQTGISVVSGKQTYTAVWEKNAFRVDWNQNYGGAPLIAPTLHVDKDTIVPEPAASAATLKPGTVIPAKPTRDDHVFAGWYTDADATKQNETTAWNFTTGKVTQDMTLYAKWTPRYTVTYNAMGGTPPSILTKQITHGDSYGMHPTTTKNGHTFLGWYTAATGGSKVEATASVTSSHILYAQWVSNAVPTFTVRFVDHDGTLLKAETVVSGGSATPPANPSRSGWTFGGWSGSYTNVLSHQTVTATYSYNGSGGGGTTTPTVPTQRPRVPAPTPAPEPEPAPEPAPVVTQPAPAPAPEPEPVPEPVIPETLMNDGGVPLGGFFQTGVWSLLNLILVIVGIFIALLRFVTARRQQRGAENGTERRAWLTLPVILTLVVSIAALVVFLLMEDFSKPMAWVDNHTLIIAILFVVEMVLVALSNVRSAAHEGNA